MKQGNSINYRFTKFLKFANTYDSEILSINKKMSHCYPIFFKYFSVQLYGFELLEPWKEHVTSLHCAKKMQIRVFFLSVFGHFLRSVTVPQIIQNMLIIVSITWQSIMVYGWYRLHIACFNFKSFIVCMVILMMRSHN